MSIQLPGLLRVILDRVFAYKILLLSVLLASLSIGLTFYLAQDKLYQSTCLLSYQRQKINPSEMSPDIDESIAQMVGTLTQIVNSRSNLEKIIMEEKLYQEKLRRLPMEDVVNQMRDNIQVIPSEEGNTFRVSFSGKNPEKVARVANALASRFIEENLKYREERASDVSVYTNEELEMARKSLNQKEQLMRDYKLKYYNEMPDQREANIGRLVSLQDLYQRKQDSIQSLEATQVLVRERLAERKKILEKTVWAAEVIPESTSGEISPQQRDLMLLQKYRQQFDELAKRYKDKHPKLISLKEKITDLEAKLKRSTQPEEQGEMARDPEKTQISYDEELQSLELQLKDLGLKIKLLEDEKKRLRTQIEQYEKWVEATPVREAEWAELSRKYKQLKARYDQLVSQSLLAKSALNLERKQKGSQFKLEDSARVATKPIKPDFLKIMRIALLSGIALGGGFVFLMSKLETSFSYAKQLQETVGVEVLCSVPRVTLPGEVWRSRIWSILGYLYMLVATSGVGFIFYHFWKNGKIVIGEL